VLFLQGCSPPAGGSHGQELGAQPDRTHQSIAQGSRVRCRGQGLAGQVHRRRMVVFHFCPKARRAGELFLSISFSQTDWEPRFMRTFFSFCHLHQCPVPRCPVQASHLRRTPCRSLCTPCPAPRLVLALPVCASAVREDGGGRGREVNV
jgi:hypothetical protein